MERLLNSSEMAARLNRCSKTFLKYVDKYDIPHIRLGRDLLFDPVKVKDYLENYHQKRTATRLKAPHVRKGRFAGVLS